MTCTVGTLGHVRLMKKTGKADRTGTGNAGKTEAGITMGISIAERAGMTCTGRTDHEYDR